MACQSCKWVRTETSWRSPVVLAQLAGFCSLTCCTIPPAMVASARLRQQQAGSVIQQKQIFNRKSWGNISILAFQPGQLLSPRLPRIFILLLEKKKKGFKRAVSGEDSRADLCPSLVSFMLPLGKASSEVLVFLSVYNRNDLRYNSMRPKDNDSRGKNNKYDMGGQ